MRTDQHGDAAEQLDRIGNEHDAALRQRISKRSHERGQHYVGEYEELLKYRCLPRLSMETRKQRNRSKQQRVVRECGEELRGQDDIEPAVHVVEAGSGGESEFFSLTIIASLAGRFIPH